MRTEYVLFLFSAKRKSCQSKDAFDSSFDSNSLERKHISLFIQFQIFLKILSFSGSLNETPDLDFLPLQ